MAPTIPTAASAIFNPTPEPRMVKTDSGRFFEDFELGERIVHATPRTVTEGDRAMVTALYGSRFALGSADSFAATCGLERAPLDDLAAFHIVFGKTVPDISLNAIANLGYAEGRFHRPVYPGDTLSSVSEVIGRRQTSKGEAGIVWVRTTGRNQRDETVLDYARWVLVRKRDAAAGSGEEQVPELAEVVAEDDLIVPEGLDFGDYDLGAAGSPHLWDDYEIGERIDHADRVTLEEAEHMLATRLWQNTARVHFDATARDGGKRLIYGGHIISMARALSFNGLANAQMVAAINGGTHAGPAHAGDTIRAFSAVIDKAETGVPSVGALRTRLVAARAEAETGFETRGPDGRYLPGVLLDMDLWLLMPRR